MERVIAYECEYENWSLFSCVFYIKRMKMKKCLLATRWHYVENWLHINQRLLWSVAGGMHVCCLSLHTFTVWVKTCTHTAAIYPSTARLACIWCECSEGFTTEIPTLSRLRDVRFCVDVIQSIFPSSFCAAFLLVLSILPSCSLWSSWQSTPMQGLRAGEQWLQD